MNIPHLFDYTEDSPSVIIPLPLVQLYNAAPKPTCAAALIALFEQYTIATNSHWVTKTLDEIRQDLLGLFGRQLVSKTIQWLVSHDYLHRQMARKDDFNRTYSYCLNVKKVRDALKQYPSGEVF